MRVHLDTDIGSDADDACALAMLLGWPDVEVAGITTAVDPGGHRAGYVAYFLKMLGREDIPVAAGADRSLSHGMLATPTPEDRRHWPKALSPRPSPRGTHLELMLRNIEQGATVVAIGPYTNLAQLENARNGTLAQASVVAMGGWTHPPADGLPDWGPEHDWNVQWDTKSAAVVARSAGELTLSTLPTSLQVPLRAADLPRLRALGPVGEMLADQSEQRAADGGYRDLGPAHPGLPDDLLNFHYDPLACAVAVGWPGATVESTRLRTAMDGKILRFVPDESGRPVRVVVDVDGEAFTETWLDAVEAACRRTQGHDVRRS